MKRFEFVERPAVVRSFSIADADGDREIKFTVPKTALLLHSMVQRDQQGIVADMFEWLGQGLSEEDNQYIVDRWLDNDDKAFDTEAIVTIIEYLLAEDAGRPTKP